MVAIEVEFDRLQHTLVRIQRIVACIAGDVGGNRRKPHMLILWQHQIRNEYARQISLAEAITQEEDIVLFLVQKPLQLKLPFSTCEE